MKKQSSLNADFTLKIGSEQLHLSATVPNSKIPASEMIPCYQQLTDNVVKQSIDKVQKSGKTISCKEGCAACCRQPVPLTTIEAMSLIKHINSMPESRQRSIRESFNYAIQCLKDAGLYSKLLKIKELSTDARRELSVEYFHHQIDCPFLVDNKCSIYLQRPMQCREFLVMSDPKHCHELNAEQIEHIPISLRITPALQKQSRETINDTENGWILLPFLLEWAKNTNKRVKKKLGKVWLQNLIEHAKN